MTSPTPPTGPSPTHELGALNEPHGDASHAPAPAPGRPEARPPAPWAFPAPQEHTLDNGLRVLLFDMPGQYVVSCRLGIPLLLASEPRAVEGVSTIMARCLDEGTARHTADEMAELWERHGIAFGAGVTERGVIVDLDVTQWHLGTALELATECLTAPAFPEDEVARHVRLRLADIDQERARGAHRAAIELAAVFYDERARASRPAGGTRESVEAIDRQAVVDRHRALRPQGATLVVAGDLTGIDALAEIERTLGSWRPGPAQGPDHSEALVAAGLRHAPGRARVVLVDRPGSVQTEISLGGPGPDRRAREGWAPYPVLAFVVGGAPQSRIDQVLREEKGYTYGFGAGFRPRSAGGLFTASGAVRTEVTADAVATLLDILDRVGDEHEGITEAEARAGRDFVARTAPGRFTTADVVAEEAVGLALDGLDTTFTTRMLQQLPTLGASDLRAAWSRWAGEWTIVLVGDAAAIKQPLREALGGREVEVRAG